LLKEQLELCLLLGAQQENRVYTIKTDVLECPAPAIRTDALIAVIDFTTIIENVESPTF